jgi:two-component system, NtrC family, response regulator GlrR
MNVSVNATDDQVVDFQTARREFEAAYCRFLLSRTGGNVSTSALLAGKDRKDFYYLMNRCGVVANDFRTRRKARRRS